MLFSDLRLHQTNSCEGLLIRVYRMRGQHDLRFPTLAAKTRARAQRAPRWGALPLVPPIMMLMASFSYYDSFRTASFERISQYTVGVAVKRNREIGTGTLVASSGHCHILTAAHVIEDFDPGTLRFWLRPGPMKEKRAADMTDEEVGNCTAGITLPIVEVSRDNELDIAVLRLDDSFRLPEEAECYDACKSHDFANWQEDRINGLSLFVFGFPTDNSRFVRKDGETAFRFVGCATHVSDYSSEFNRNTLGRLASPISPAKDFVFEYSGDKLGFDPGGLSGAGVWVIPDDQTKKVWSPDPLLIGVVHRYARTLGAIVATKLPAFLTWSWRQAYALNQRQRRLTRHCRWTRRLVHGFEQIIRNVEVQVFAGGGQRQKQPQILRLALAREAR